LTPCAPKTNRKAERFVQTSFREWAYARAYQTSEQQRGAPNSLPSWFRYNWKRPHSSLNAKPPRQQTRSLRGQPVEAPHLSRRLDQSFELGERGLGVFLETQCASKVALGVL